MSVGFDQEEIPYKYEILFEIKNIQWGYELQLWLEMLSVKAEIETLLHISYFEPILHLHLLSWWPWKTNQKIHKIKVKYVHYQLSTCDESSYV